MSLKDILSLHIPFLVEYDECTVVVCMFISIDIKIGVVDVLINCLFYVGITYKLFFNSISQIKNYLGSSSF